MFRVNYVEFKKEVHEAIDHGYPPEEIEEVLQAIQKKHRVDVDLTSRSLFMAYIIGHPKAAHNVLDVFPDENWAEWVGKTVRMIVRLCKVFVIVSACVLILKLLGFI